jgi:hypothetical protein
MAVHVLQDAVAQHQVGALLPDDGGQVTDVALDRPQLHVHLRGPALRGGQ